MRGHTYPLFEYEILELADAVMSAGVSVPENVMEAWKGVVRLGEGLVGEANWRAERLGEGMMEGGEELEGFVRTLGRTREWIVGEEMRRERAGGKDWVEKCMEI